MKKYLKYKTSKIDLINFIPEHWKETRMRYIGYLFGGLSGKNANDFNQTGNLKNKKYIPFTNIANNLKIDPENLQEVVIDEGENHNEVRKGDLFFLMSSENYDDVGRSSVLDVELETTYLNSFCKGFRITRKDIIPNFINYQLHSKQLRHNLLIGANGFTRINLKIEKVNDLFIAYPEVEEQKNIVKYLDKKTNEIDQLIEDKKELIKLIEEEKIAFINQVITKGIINDKNLIDSKIEFIGFIPENWNLKKIKHIVSKVGSGVTPSGGASVYELTGIPLLRSQNIHFDGLRLDDVAYINEDIHNNMKNSKVFSGDVLLNITGASIGRCFYVDENLGEANVNQHVSILRPNEKVLTKYLYYILYSNIGQEQIRKEQTGSGREGLNFEVLKNFLVPIPEISEQKTIIDYIESECNLIDFRIIKTKKLIDLLIEYRSALISEVVTGKVNIIE